ncbi:MULTISPECIES: AAWKG family protein [unclassified Streptomyces]|uniref:AAWKG family protein n=1 Tax=unclassified Streptomyces TaxID=2593676 RepID=UPI0036E73A84
MATDSWEDILHLLTGWSMVRREDVTGVTGDSGIPWVNISIVQGGHVFDDQNDYTAWILPRSSNKGFYFEFYAVTDHVRKWKVEITYLDNPAGHRYWGDSDGVLSSLTGEQHSSVKGDIVVRGDGAPDNEQNGVRLSAFAELAKSYDAAGDFFKRQTAVLQEWKTQLGSEQASWKGNAAGAFWHLVDDLHTKYENYTAQLQPPGFVPLNTSPSTQYVSRTTYGNDLVGAEESLFQAYVDLHGFYRAFYSQQAAKPITVNLPDGSTTEQQIPADPLDVLNQVFIELGRWIIDNNARLIHSDDSAAASGTSSYLAKTLPGFQDSIHLGKLTDTGVWHALVQEAVTRWTKNIQTNLDVNARQVVTTLKSKWSPVLDPNWNPAFSFTDTPSSLTSDVQTEIQDKTGAGLDGDLDDVTGSVKSALSNSDGLSDFTKNLAGNGDFPADSFTGNGEFSADSLAGNGDFSADSFTGNGEFSADSLVGNGGTGGQLSADPSDISVPDISVPDITGQGAFGDSGSTDVNSLLGGGAGISPFGSGLPVNNIDGSTTALNGNGVMTTYPNGDTVTRNADGSITSTFSDGTSRTVTPEGDVTTVDAQGHSSTSHLGVGESLTNPDGTSVTRNADGSLTQTAPDGTKTTTFTNGSSEIVTPDGETQLTSPDGTVSHINSDGSLTMDNLDGSKVTVHPDGDVTTVDAQGHSSTSHLEAGQSITNPDGGTTTVDAKGDIITRNPDGSSTTLRPDGTITTTEATSTGTGVNGGGHISSPSFDIPTFSGGSQTAYTPDGTSITSHPDGTTEIRHPDGSGIVTSSDGQFQPIPSEANAATAADTTTDAAAAGGVGASAASMTGGAATDSQNAMGLLSPMMMMAGMSRMGGQQGGQGGGERDRDLYDGNDMDGAVVQHGGSPFASRSAPDEDPEEWEEEETDSDELLGPRRTSTESSFGPSGGSPPQTRSSDWAGKSKDVWGTEEGGLPASIGH